MSSVSIKTHAHMPLNAKPTSEIWDKAAHIADSLEAQEGRPGALMVTERTLADASLSPAGVETWSWVLHILSQRRVY